MTDALALPEDLPKPAADLDADKPQMTPPATDAPTTAEPTIAEPAPPAASISPDTTPTPTRAPTLAPEAEAAAPPRERELVADPRLGVLRAMFPDFDDSLLQSVLDSVHGDTDLAIDALLGMSDPDYTSEHPPAAQQAPQTQEDLDEQLARTLMLEDEREQHAWRAQQQQPPPSRHPQQQQHQQQPQLRRQGTSESQGQEKDTMQEFQEQFNKLAESGKKTFGSLLSKVKAKIQEFDQPPSSSAANSNNPNSASASSWNAGVGGDTYPYDAETHPYPSAGQQQQRGQGGQGQGQAYQAYQNPQQQAQQAQQQATMPAYYDPNGGGGDGGGSPTGYDAAPRSTSPPITLGSPPPPTTNAGAPAIDGGKLGMLPKRPVSLLRTASPPTGSGAPPSSDDELEYAENPFEEGKK